MSAAPAAPTGGGAGGGGDSKPVRVSNSCWSCRVMPAGALLLSAVYVLNGARRTRRQGGASTWTAAQVLFAAGLAALGIVVVTDYNNNAGKAQRKT